MPHTLSQVWRQEFWMMLLGSPTPKRTVTFANGAFIAGLDKGTLTKDFRVKNTQFESTRRALTFLA